MHENTKNWKNPIIVILILVIVFVAGYFYTTRNREGDVLLSNITPQNETSAVDGDLIKTLGKLQKLSMDDSIFSNSVWLSLHDFSRIISPEPKGRGNPFAPL